MYSILLIIVHLLYIMQSDSIHFFFVHSNLSVQIIVSVKQYRSIIVQYSDPGNGFQEFISQ
jgi:hypothetical protein